jgi:thymidylate synthase (FAD)
MKIANIEVDLVDHMGSDASVVKAARVSFANDEQEFDVVKDAKLIKYLAAHKHFSPFNHTFITVRVKAPIFVARQLVKHKFMPWNEVSRRYVNDEPEFYVPSDWRLKAENVKQGSSGDFANKESLFIGDYEDVPEAYSTNDFTQLPLNLYNWLLMNNVCAEQARMVLPQNTMTTWYWSGTLGAFADMLRLRLDSHTQAETRIVAQKIRDIILPLFPISLEALLSNG